MFQRLTSHWHWECINFGHLHSIFIKKSDEFNCTFYALLLLSSVNLQLRKGWVFRVQEWYLHIENTRYGLKSTSIQVYHTVCVVHSSIMPNMQMCVKPHKCGLLAFLAFTGSRFTAEAVRLWKTFVHRDLERRGHVSYGRVCIMILSLSHVLH